MAQTDDLAAAIQALEAHRTEPDARGSTAPAASPEVLAAIVGVLNAGGTWEHVGAAVGMVRNNANRKYLPYLEAEKVITYRVKPEWS